MNTKLHSLLRRLRPWAFPAVAWLILSLMSMWLCHCNWEIRPLMCLTDGLCLMLPWLLLPPRWRGWWWLLPSIYTISLAANLLYGKFFFQIIPIELLFSDVWMNDYVLSRSILEFEVTSLLPVGGLSLLVAFWLVLRRSQPTYTLKLNTLTLCFVVVALLGAHTMQSVRIHYYRPQMTMRECLADSFSLHKLYKDDIIRHGYVLAYTFHFFEKIMCNHQFSLDDNELLRKIETAPRGELPAELAEAFAANRHKSLICIVVESLDTDALGRTVGGVRVTPTLDSLAADTSVIALTNIKHQIGLGHSSDGHVITFGGLMRCDQCPITFVNHKAALPSIFHALNFEHNFAIIGEGRAVWNAGRYLPALGFKSICDDISSLGQGTGDKAIFDAAFEVIKNSQRPFCAMVSTISMHGPYVPKNTPVTAISRSGELDSKLSYYLERTHFFDTCLANFLQQLKEADIYQQSVVLIVADHNSELHWDTFIPMFILNAGVPHRITADRALTQLDIYPTLLDVMGMANSDYWLGMGQSALRPGLPPLTDDELHQRSVLSQRLLQTDYFRTTP